MFDFCFVIVILRSNTWNRQQVRKTVREEGNIELQKGLRGY